MVTWLFRSNTPADLFTYVQNWVQRMGLGTFQVNDWNRVWVDYNPGGDYYTVRFLWTPTGKRERIICTYRVSAQGVDRFFKRSPWNHGDTVGDHVHEVSVWLARAEREKELQERKKQQERGANGLVFAGG